LLLKYILHTHNKMNDDDVEQMYKFEIFNECCSPLLEQLDFVCFKDVENVERIETLCCDRAS
jgi:hypothetical protein